jgi:hypothetical protein
MEKFDGIKELPPENRRQSRVIQDRLSNLYTCSMENRNMYAEKHAEMYI